MKNNKKNSPLNQDPKFDTTLHDYGRRAHTMTAKERSDYRTGQKHALTFAPTGGALGVAGKAIGVIKRNIGGGAFSIGQGLVRKFGTKGMKKTYDRAFTPGASQQTGPKVKTMQDFTPTVKGYDVKVIGQSPKAKPAGMNKPPGMSTPLTPKLKPTNPRGYETITLKGGRKMTKPGTPGYSRNIGGKETYSAKDPLWPEPIDRVLYPKNWK